MRKIIKYIGSDGYPVFVERDEDEQFPDGSIVVDRMPTAYEDYINGEWVYNAVGHANQLAGPHHIKEAHLTKYMEALLVKSGVTLTTGLLAVEARLQGVGVEAIADAVMVKRAEFIAKETTRQEAQLSDANPTA